MSTSNNGSPDGESRWTVELDDEPELSRSEAILTTSDSPSVNEAPKVSGIEAGDVSGIEAGDVSGIEAGDVSGIEAGDVSGIER